MDTDVFREPVRAVSPLVFITGGAGAGKSVAVKYLQKYCASKSMNCAVVAPTGIAALTAGGQTIHSFFKIPINAPLYSGSVKPKNLGGLVKHLDLLIIDEISMVRADTFDFINSAMQASRNSTSPFGGVRVVVVGDLFQLPPILEPKDDAGFHARYNTRFFTGADYFEEFRHDEIKIISLTKTFRQKSDAAFSQLLNDIRQGKNLSAVLRELNARAKRPPPKGDVLALVTRTHHAEKINSDKLSELGGDSKTYEGILTSEKQGDDKLPVPLHLELKTGAKIMVVKNDTAGRWVNGAMATVVRLGDDSIRIKLADDGIEHDVRRERWTKYRYKFNSESGQLEREPEWEYEQFPAILGWAATIHKCQGITLDRASVDVGEGAFDCGQAYVALSRCRSLDGLYLAKELRESDIQVDEKVREFYEKYVNIRS